MVLRSMLQRRQSETQESGNALEFDSYVRDPVARFLVQRLRISSLGAVVFAFIIVAFLHLGAVLGYALWQGGARFDDFVSWQFGHWPVVVYQFVTVPLLAAFYPWIMRSSGTLFARLPLDRDGVIGDDVRNIVRSGERSIEGLMKAAGWHLVPALLAIVVTVALIIQGFNNIWERTPRIGRDIWLFYMIAIPAIWLVWFLITSIAARYIATITGLFRVFTSRSGEIVRLRPWHPDRCGGLSALHEFATRMTWFIAVIGLLLILLAYVSIVSRAEGDPGISEIVSDPVLLVSLIVYAVLSPLAFLLTLWPAHRAMERAKRDRLDLLSEEFDKAYIGARSALNAEGESRDAPPSGDLLSVDLVNRIKSLQDLYDLTRAFPVWPFDIASIRRFFTAFLAPVASFMIFLGAEFLLAKLA